MRIIINEDNCDGCGYCGLWFAELPESAFGDAGLEISRWSNNDEDIGEAILNLEESCLTGAIKVLSNETEELMEVICRDCIYYRGLGKCEIYEQSSIDRNRYYCPHKEEM